MKLISIRLLNFRSFYGETPEISLEGYNGQNTIVFHGSNGAGKTTLLNAFTWVLYGKFTAAFASEEQLVNKRAIAETPPHSKVKCQVKLKWEHDGTLYEFIREREALKGEQDHTETQHPLKMMVAKDDGTWSMSREHPDDVIANILPASLHQYFFFDGERMEKSVRADKKNEISEATKRMLGVVVLERAFNHLKEAKKRLDEELQLLGDSQLRDFLKKQRDIEQEQEKCQQRQEEIVQEIEHQSVFKKEVGEELLKLNVAQEREEQRQQLEERKKSLLISLKKSKESLKKAISNQGYTALLSSILPHFYNLVDNLKQKGEITPGVSREFISRLLNSQRCICGTELCQGTHSYNAIQSLLDKAKFASLESSVYSLSSQVEAMEKEQQKFWDTADQEQAEITRLRQEIQNIELKIDEIEDKLRKDPSEEIRGLQKRLDGIEAKISELYKEQGANQQKLQDFKSDLENLERQIKRQQKAEERQVLAQRRISATQDAMERISEVRSRQELQFRQQLERRVQEIFSRISFKPYVPKISEKYELNLVETLNGIETPVAASTGENQILSLSFIGAIIEKVREWNQTKMVMLPESNTFPIVMDSPFGSLDENYRRHVAEIIPNIANQLVVMATKTQWLGEVEKTIHHRVAKEYVITFYSSKPDCEEDYIELGGVRYDLVKRSGSEFDYSTIVEVEYGF